MCVVKPSREIILICRNLKREIKIAFIFVLPNLQSMMYIIIFAKLLIAISIYSCFQGGFHVVLSCSVTMGGAVAKENLPKAFVPESKLEAKIVEAMQHRESEGTSLKSFNSIILKFPKIDSNLRKCKATFQQFG